MGVSHAVCGISGDEGAAVAGATAASFPEAVVGVAAAVVLSWDVWRPAPWLDELATLGAVRRSWGDLAGLLRGPDAPLVPYYAVLKYWYAAGEYLPVSGWLWLRVPSLAFGVSATVLLTRFLRRRLGTLPALTAGFLLVAFAGLTRNSQEARVNALAPLLACACWMAWSQLIHEPPAAASPLMGCWSRWAESCRCSSSLRRSRS